MEKDKKALIVVLALIIITFIAYPWTSLERYLFTWNEFPGKDTEKVLKFLSDELGVKWAKDAGIKKSGDGNFINITDSKNFLTFKKEREIVILNISDKIYKYYIVEENKQLMVYEANFMKYGIQPYEFSKEKNFLKLITPIFTHGDEWHIIGNMLFLLVFGIFLATFIGWKKFLIVYFLGGIFGNVAWLLYPIIDPNSSSSYAVGASGAVFAVMAALAVAKPENAADYIDKSKILKVLTSIPVFGLYLFIRSAITPGILGFLGIFIFFLYLVIADALTGGNTAHAAHLGGLIMGTILGYIFRVRAENFELKEEKNKKAYNEIMPVHDYTKDSKF